jgi:diaminopimelate decarboxylase
VPHLIAYSVKANGNLGVLRTLAGLGAGADIVSGGELHRARMAGIPGERIVFSGVGKTVPSWPRRSARGSTASTWSPRGSCARSRTSRARRGTRAPIALRVNPDVETPTPHAYTRTGHAATKFGIPIADARATCTGSRPACRGSGPRGRRAHRLADPGGGPVPERAGPGPRALATTSAARGWSWSTSTWAAGSGSPTPGGEGIAARDFAAAILPRPRRGSALVVEPGRFIVGEAGVLVTRVLYVKEGGGKRFVITDAGMNDLLRPSHYSGYHAVEPVESHARPSGHVDVVGPDLRDRRLPRAGPGDRAAGAGELLAIRTVGAYGFSMSSTYNQRPRPAEVLVEGGEARLVRRRETIEDLVAAELDL